MARTRYESDPGLTRRMLGTMFGLGLLYVVIAALLIALGVSTIFVLIIAGGGLFVQWFFSDSLALSSMRAVEVSPEQAPQLHALIDRLCVMADMTKPRVAIADTEVPNAFATGRSSSRSVICVTTGILRRLDVGELEGVLAHELSHVAHRDVTVMTLASFAGILAGLLTRTMMWGGLMGGGRRDDRDSNTALVFLVVTLVSALVYVVSFVLTRTLSRYRELSADRAGALLTGNPSALASALQKVSGEIVNIPDRDLRRMESVSALAFAPALTTKASLSTLFMTHPPLQKRLEQLAKISAELGQR